MNDGKAPCLYNIPAGCSFLEALARGLLAQYDGNPLDLARVLILLPSRRACRSMREAFLRIGGHRPLMLPRLHPLGDVDEEELSVSFAGLEQEFSLPPAIDPLHRQLLLAQLVEKTGRGRGFAQDLALADALARLMDEVYTENLTLDALPDVVDHADFAQHWQVSIDFLSILSTHWPDILTSQGLMDMADRRNRLINALGAYWQETPPAYPVIAAGSVGSIPANRFLLGIVGRLPNGCVILPGLDRAMDDESWRALSDTHPQKNLKRLLADMDIERETVKDWPFCPTAAESETSRRNMAAAFASEIMRPPETTHAWQDLRGNGILSRVSDLNIERYDCGTPQEEALVVALALRRALEEKGNTAALVTPDRKLARRVAMACRRWGIEIDDSAGEKLSQTPVGLYVRHALCAVSENFKAVPLLAFCKYSLCMPTDPDGMKWRSAIRALDKDILRGPATNGLADIRSKIDRISEEINRDQTQAAQHSQTIDVIETAFAPLTALVEKGEASLKDWCEAHVQVLENFCPPDILWKGQDAETAAGLFNALQENSGLLGGLTLRDYAVLIDNAMGKASVRPLYGQHPRVSILGQLESRLIVHDTVILGGLNEGTWPAAPKPDPWMSRMMRRRFGLPAVEQTVGIAAHDFVQNISASHVVLTRSMRVDSTPTVPSRWLRRMDTVLDACGAKGAFSDGPLLAYARSIDVADTVTPVTRPAPCPSVSARPRRLSVTRIDTWMKDPYSIYARDILRLRKLTPLDQPLDAALRGTLLHGIMERFTALYPDHLPQDDDAAITAFMGTAGLELARIGAEPDVRHYWTTRLAKIAGWVVTQERTRRAGMRPLTEKDGRVTFHGTGGDFILTARADRIDVARDNTGAALIDYKSGGKFAKSGLKEGRYPQLPLEALIVESGGFDGVAAMPVTELAYWVMTGAGAEGGELTSLSAPDDLKTAMDAAREGLQRLIDTFDDSQTPYYSTPHAGRALEYNDYEHLARLREWASFSDAEEAE